MSTVHHHKTPAPTDSIITEMRSEAEHLREGFSKESDRGVSLVASAFFDTTLERLLCARFSSRSGKAMGLIEPLFEGLGPLATFSSKIRFAYAIDLLQDWIAFDLDLIRRIRNEFSHSFEPATFDDPVITAKVDQLQSYERAVASIAKKEGVPDIREIPKALQSRYKFNLTCARVGALLQAKVIVQRSDSSEEFKNSFMLSSAL